MALSGQKVSMLCMVMQSPCVVNAVALSEQVQGRDQDATSRRGNF